MSREKPTLEYVTKCIDAVIETDEYLDKLCNLNFDAFEQITSFGDTINLLEYLTYDTYHWLSWYAFEKEFGRNKGLQAYDMEDNLIPTDTIEDVLNVIEKNIQEDIENNKEIKRDPDIISEIIENKKKEKEYLEELRKLGVHIAYHIKTTKIIDDFLAEYITLD